MTDDRKRDVLRQYVAEVLAVERHIEAALARYDGVTQAHPDAAAVVQRFRAIPAGHRQALREYLEAIGADADRAEALATGSLGEFPAASGEARAVSSALLQISAAFNYAALSYALLFEAALRLYEPPLRALAPKHLRAYTEAAQAIDQLVAAVAARELEREGFGCACICPMCGIGACGCVALATATLSTARRETAPNGETGTGFRLQPPRPGSQLAQAGLQGGDRLLAVDSQEVSSIPEIQAAIRKHQLGDEVRLLIQRGGNGATEVVVKHLSDYPAG